MAKVGSLFFKGTEKGLLALGHSQENQTRTGPFKQISRRKSQDAGGQNKKNFGV